MTRPELGRIFHTVRYLRFAQVFGRAVRHIYKPAIDLAMAPSLRYLNKGWVLPVPKPISLVSSGRFRFLNLEQSLDSFGDWNNPARPKLWLYNLHYFDDLNAVAAAERRDDHLDLINRWISDNPPATGNGWESYPLALRIVNWIKWSLAGNELPTEMLHSLAVQVRYLRRRLEYHLLGNHLIANAKALLFAGLFYQGPEAEEWLRKGRQILAAEVTEQILPDGGHFERSPMYHAVILDDLLDLLNLFQTYGQEIPADWEDACVRMRAWLKALSHPDGNIVLFNDAAFGIAPTWMELDAYAARLGLARPIYPPCPIARFSETGYIRCEAANSVLFLDVGPVGPDYIPGHAHADTLNFEWSLFGQRVIVDCGTSTYEKSTERQRQRGTAAHNTVSVDGEDSSEVWGGFRVARRAKPFGLETGERDGKIRVACCHDGYRRLPGRPNHCREWLLASQELTVIDRISGGYSQAVGRFFLHPEAVPRMQDDGLGGEILLPSGAKVAWVIRGGVGRLVVATYHKEFGLAIANKCLEVVFAGPEVVVRFYW